jgi:hypothetical protein
MNIRLATLAVVLVAASAPAFAGDRDPVRILAQETGLTERKVNMILGTRTSFAEYPRCYQRSVAKLRKSVGEGRYDQLMNGNLVAAAPQAKAQALLAALEEQRNANTP